MSRSNPQDFERALQAAKAAVDAEVRRRQAAGEPPITLAGAADAVFVAVADIFGGPISAVCAQDTLANIVSRAKHSSRPVPQGDELIRKLIWAGWFVPYGPAWPPQDGLAFQPGP